MPTLNDLFLEMSPIISSREPLLCFVSRLSCLNCSLLYYPCFFASFCLASDFDWNSIDTSQLPDSYKMNSPREKKLLRIADHYHQQYTHLCPERKPLFLHPVNECGVEVKGGVEMGPSCTVFV